MVFELREVAAYEGTLSGEFVMNNRNGLSVGGKLNARRMAMNPLLTDLADLDRFSGTGDADLAFLGVGQSLDEIMRSLNGSGAVNVGRGAIEGIDLDQIRSQLQTIQLPDINRALSKYTGIRHVHAFFSKSFSDQLPVKLFTIQAGLGV